MLRPRTGHGGVGVEMFDRDAVAVHVRFGCGPVDEVIRFTALNGPDTFAGLVQLEVPAEDAIATFIVIPKRHIYRVEGSCDVEGTVMNGFPDQSVRRGKSEKSVHALTADGLVSLFGRD